MKSILVFALFFMQTICFASSISSNLTAVFDPQKMTVKLKWQNNDPRISGFILQRSEDNDKWTDLYKIDIAEFSKNNMEKYADQHPDAKKNYYRLKMIIDKDNSEFSAPIMVIMGKPASSWVIYPVPVSSVLNLQYTGSDPIKGVITVFIQNAQGRILTRFRSSSLNRILQIPLSNLCRGIYDVKIMIMNEVVWNQRFVK